MVGRPLYGILLLLVGSGGLVASNVATQTIVFSVDAISEIAVVGNPAPFITTIAQAGSDPSDVIDNSTTYAVTTNGSDQKVTASLDFSMPTGTQMCLVANPPSGAVSVGSVMLDTTDQNLITGVTKVAESNLLLSYDFEVAAFAGVIPLTSRIVTFTLTP